MPLPVPPSPLREFVGEAVASLNTPLQCSARQHTFERGVVRHCKRLHRPWRHGQLQNIGLLSRVQRLMWPTMQTSLHKFNKATLPLRCDVPP